MERIIQVLLLYICLFFCNITSAQIGVSGPTMEIPSKPTCANVETMKSVPCSDGGLFYAEGQAIVQRAFNQRDYEKLDEVYKNWCTGNERFPDGRWKLSQYASGLESSFSAWNTWDQDLTKIKSWQSKYPDSEAAKFIEAVYWYAYAWKARGNGYSDTVSKEGWDIFQQRLNKAKDIFADLLSKDDVCPAVYARMLDTMLSIGDKEPELKAVYERGTKKHPQYHNIYFAMAQYYDLRWHGNADLYNQFVIKATEKTKAFEGRGMYARLYWLVDNRNGIPFNEKLGTPPFWTELRKGYEDLMSRYPKSIHNIGKYAGVACRSSDSNLYKKLRAIIDGYQNDVEFYDSVDVCDLRHGWKKDKSGGAE